MTKHSTQHILSSVCWIFLGICTFQSIQIYSQKGDFKVLLWTNTIKFTILPPLLLIILVNCTSDFLISSHQGLSFILSTKIFFLSVEYTSIFKISACVLLFVLFYLLFRYFKVSSRYIGWFLIFLHQYNHLKLFSSEHSNSCVPQVFIPCFTAIFTYFANFLWFLIKPTG